DLFGDGGDVDVVLLRRPRVLEVGAVDHVAHHDVRVASTPCGPGALTGLCHAADALACGDGDAFADHILVVQVAVGEVGVGGVVRLDDDDPAEGAGGGRQDD